MSMSNEIILSDKHFIDWEADVFGYGYGSGEEYTTGLLIKFFANLENGRSYNYMDMEAELGAEQFWLLINALCHADMIDYGMSTRGGWLTTKGETLRDYLYTKSIDEVCEVLFSIDGFNYVMCFRDLCQCETPCNNPLF